MGSSSRSRDPSPRSCGSAPPEDVLAYEDCPKLNDALLPKRSDDPHEGRKNVYACNVPCDEVDSRPFPDGALIVKESIKEGQDYPWLIATARKSKGEWRWDEYTRNFASEDFAHILASEEVCIDCHRKWKAADWIATGRAPSRVLLALPSTPRTSGVATATRAKPGV